MTTFVFDEGAGPRIHAFLIAAGAYRAAQKPAASIQLQPLPGVVTSAVDFAGFLVERTDKLFYRLGSIELLISDPHTAAGRASWQGQTVDEPTLANINTALQGWLQRLERDEKSMALFYAGGHGCYKAGIIHYFAEDSGSWGDPLAQTIRLTSFQTGMSTKRAAYQWFIFDCCQDLPKEIQRELEPTSGTNLLGTDSEQIREAGQLRITAANPGRQAFSGEKTHLMDALDMALKNHAAGPVANGWGVKPSLLMDAINYYGDKKYRDEWTTCTVSSNAYEIDCLHRLDNPPEVDVVISTEPDDAYPEATIKLTDLRTQQIAQDVNGVQCNWEPHNALNRQITLFGGFYQATASFDPGMGYTDSADLFQPLPPHFAFPLKVEEE